jgi:phosphate transport system substrate-binding protein
VWRRRRPAAEEAVATEARKSPPRAPAAEAPAALSAAGAGLLPAVNPLEVSGDIIVAGSSTVYPLTERMAERFRDEGYAGNITIDSIGTGAGFERFCVAGESDISNASRAIKDSEIESCRTIGREPVEFRVGTDALAVVVNPGNDWIGEEGLTLAEVAQLFSAEVTNWSDVNPAWPAEPVKRFSPGTDSGTFDYFIEAVMDPAFPDAGEEALLSAANLQLSEDDNVLVQGVSGDPYAIGYFGFAYFEENAASLRDLAIERRGADGGDGQRWRVPAGAPALHLLGRRRDGRQAAGRRLHQLLPDFRQRRSDRCRLLPGVRRGA